MSASAATAPARRAPVLAGGARRRSHRPASRRVARLTLPLLVGCALATAGLSCAGHGGEEADLDLHRAANATLEARHDWARLYYERDLERHPDRLGSLRAAGLAWLSGYQQSLTRGTELLRRYLEQAPEDRDIRRRVIANLLTLGELEAARATLRGLGEEAEDLRLRAEVLATVDPAAARLAIAAALARAPGDGAILATAARLLDELGERDEALALARRAVDAGPLRSSGWYLLGRLARDTGEAAVAQRALAIHGRLQRVLAEGTLPAPTPAEEVQLWDELAALGLAPSFEARRRHADALAAAGRGELALAIYEQLAGDPGLDSTQRAAVATRVGARGHRALARRLFTQVLEQAPDDPAAVASLALLDLEAGAPGLARARLAAARERSPHVARLLVLAARVAAAEDRPLAEVRGPLERAVELAPWAADWRLELADLLLAGGERAAARRLLDGAPEEHPRIAAYRAAHGLLPAAER